MGLTKCSSSNLLLTAFAFFSIVVGACATSTAKNESGETEPLAEQKASEKTDPSSTQQAPKEVLTLGGKPVRFLSTSEAALFLETPDGFTQALSEFDRSFRLRTEKKVDDKKFRAFIAKEAMAFSDEEKRGWSHTIGELDSILENLQLPFPDELLLIKTSGKEELGAGGYTRRNAIVLAHVENRPEKDKYNLGLLAHELFHVLSRQSPEFRDALYALVDFFPCSPIPIPASVEATRLTNPDAFSLSHCILLSRKDTPAGAKSKRSPVLRVGSTLKDALAKKSWFRSLEIHLLPISDDNAEIWLAKDTDFQERLSKNTHYNIHAEEMLADNFALWVRSKNKTAKSISDVDFLEQFSTTISDFTLKNP